MSKIKLSVAALVLGFSIVGLAPKNSVQAEERTPFPVITHETQGDLVIDSYFYEEPVSYDFIDVPLNSVMYIPYDETVYETSTKTLYKKKSWGTVVKNNSSLNDSVSRTVSRTKFANGSIGTSAETAVNWKLIQGKIGINGEVSWGKSSTVSVTYTWNIPAKSTTTIETGSKAVKTSGKIVRYSKGKVASSKAVNADYSYDDYSDKTSKPL